MNFKYFCTQLEERLQMPLPGKEAQLIMTPPERIEFDKHYKKPENPKISSVLVLLYPEKSFVNSIFIKRSDNTGVHSGQIAFPGGRKEEQDKNLQETALRETYEEIGVSEDKIQILGELSSLYIPPSNFLVYPFVGALQHKPKIIANEKEVADVLHLPISLFNSNNMGETIRFSQTLKGRYSYPHYEIYNNIIWGATAMIMSELQEVIYSF